MTSPLAVAEDVEIEIMRPLSPVEVMAVGQWITQLSALIRYRRPGIDALISDQKLPQEVVVGAIAASIARKLSNPEGKMQESVDDYAYRRADAVADGTLYISDADWAMLTPPSATGGRVRSVRLAAYGDYQ